MDMQALIDGMNAKLMRERAETQMTLGYLITALECMPQYRFIDGIKEPHSYRGYYSDLAFEQAGDKVKVSDALDMCKGAMGKVFKGYKGGDFVMGELTPVWIAEYGCCGKKIMELKPDGSFVTAEDA